MLTAPRTTFTEDVYRFSWPHIGVDMVLDRLAEARDNDIRCELTVTLAPPHLLQGLLYSGRLLLLGPGSRRDVLRALSGRTENDAEWDWPGMLEQVCTMARDRYRRGEPIVDLSTVEIGAKPRWLLEPFILAEG